MKPPSRCGSCGSQRGVALVLTLAILVLATMLVIAMFVRMSSERVDSSASIRQSEARQMAAGVVDLVKSTITQAASGYESGADGKFTASRTAWASQPGLIRTWKEDGTAYKTYRLYSSGPIVNTGTINLTTEQSDINGWKSGGTSFNALWCDLNAPAASGTNANTLSYPIVTPPKDAKSGSAATDTNNGVPTDDPATAVQEGVQGFAITSAPGFTSGTSPGPTNNPAPMPVKWLYVLQDGTFVTPTGTGAVATVDGASQANPIVGRVAYWTDDETCKVNINTASEYFYWQAPATYTTQDKTRALYQPGVDEYQRYPGHPATTSLSAVFEKLGYPGSSETDSERAVRYQKAFNITPRVSATKDGKLFSGANGGGSQAGTTKSYLDATTRLALDPDRLFVTSEEILFSPLRSQQLVADGVVSSPADLASRKFFLTAQSAAPDLNWLGTPRISLWPLNQNEKSKWSPYDKLLERCSTLNNCIYYFQRTSGFDTSADIDMARNRQLYNYLRNLLNKPIPGAGGKTYASKTSRNVQQILTSIFDFIRTTINLRYVGGYTGSGTSAIADPNKSYYFPPEQAVGYMGSLSPAPTVLSDGGTKTKGLGAYPVITDVLLHFWASKPSSTLPSGEASQTTDYPATFPVAPPTVTNTNILRTIQMNLVLNMVIPQMDNQGKNPQFQIKVAGTPSWSIGGGPDPVLDATVVGSGSMNLPDAGGNVMRMYAPHRTAWSYNTIGGFIGEGAVFRGFTNLTKGQNDTSFKTRDFSRTPGANNFTLYGDPVTLSIPVGNQFTNATGQVLTNSAGQTITRQSYQEESLKDGVNLSANARPAMMTFNGGTITVSIYPGLPDGTTAETNSAATTDTPLQTYTIDVPNCTLPVPVLGSAVAINSDATEGSPPPMKSYYDLGDWTNRTLYSRLTTYCRLEYSQPSGASTNAGKWHSMDVLRGVTLDPQAPHKGDLRVVGLSQTIPATWWKSEYATNGAEKNFWISKYISGNSSSVAKLDSTETGYDNYLQLRVGAPSMDGMQRGGVANVGDFMNGIGPANLGGYLQASDMGATVRTAADNPYFGDLELSDTRALYNNLVYSPARMVPSPAILGQLSTYASEATPNPWETLLFCRNPHGGTSSHTGWQDPKDHYLLDLFNMPVVEPYAISQPLTTQGQINLNQTLAPFGYIDRTTGLHAALKNMRVYAFTDKRGVKNKTFISTDTTLALDVPKTIDLIKSRAPFITASEFTEVFLVPEGQTASTVDSFWTSQKGTGDDLREAPYMHIYPKITTKSNTYTVHMRVQALKQTGAGGWDKWDEARDQVMSEYRGSATIERYIDPNDPDVPDFALPANYSKNLAPYYRWRTVAETQFIP